eukprot:scaffold12269_cov41-Cyclotella_meneghiniana.AAC.4
MDEVKTHHQHANIFARFSKQCNIRLTEPSNSHLLEPEEPSLWRHSQYTNNHMVFPGPRKSVRQICDEECQEVFNDIIDVEKFTVAYSKPTTIGSVIAKSHIYEEVHCGGDYYAPKSTPNASWQQLLRILCIFT